MRLIGLTRGQFAIVDDEDFDRVNEWKWQAMIGKWGHKYAQRKKWNGKTYDLFLMHQFVLGVRGIRVDHISGDGLDNQKVNLRISTQAQNSRNRKVPITNTSGFKGVTLRKDTQVWRAYITFEGKRSYLGNFKNPKQAAAAYDVAALKLHGEFARTNKMIGLLT